MSETIECDPQEFSLSGDDEAKLLEAVAPLGLMSHKVVVHKPKLVVLVTLANCESDSQLALAEVRAHLKGIGRAQPAMCDKYGTKLLPTGTIQVRFFEAPTDDDLNEFSKQAGLRVLKRNEFQPEQASFEPVDMDTADLSVEIEKVSKHPEVRKAWPEVLTRYKR